MSFSVINSNKYLDQVSLPRLVELCSHHGNPQLPQLIAKVPGLRKEMGVRHLLGDFGPCTFKTVTDIPKDVVNLIGSYLQQKNPLGELSIEELDARLRIMHWGQNWAKKSLEESNEVAQMVLLGQAYKDPTIPAYPENSFSDLKRKEFLLQQAAESGNRADLDRFLAPNYFLEDCVIHGVRPCPASEFLKKIEDKTPWKGIGPWDIHLNIPATSFPALTRALVYAAHAGNGPAVSYLFRQYGSQISSSDLWKVVWAAGENPDIHSVIAEFVVAIRPREHGVLERSLFCLGCNGRWNEVLDFLKNMKPLFVHDSSPTPLLFHCQNIFTSALSMGREEVIIEMLQCPAIQIFNISDKNLFYSFIKKLISSPNLKKQIRERVDIELERHKMSIYWQPHWKPSWTPFFYPFLKNRNWERILKLLPIFPNMVDTDTLDELKALIGQAKADRRLDVLQAFLDWLKRDHPPKPGRSLGSEHLQVERALREAMADIRSSLPNPPRASSWLGRAWDSLFRKR